MPEIAAIVPEEQRLFLSSLSPGPAQKRLALAVVLGILVVFVVITVGLLSGIQLGAINAFVAAYATAMFVTDRSPRSSYSPSFPFCVRVPSS